MTAGWTQSDVDRVTRKQMAKATPRSKYGNVKTLVDGICFDSKKEAAQWQVLKAREHAGEIRNLQRQVEFHLYAPDMTGGWPPKACLAVAKYLADFTYIDAASGAMEVIDVKSAGTRTALYVLKKKWLALQSGIEIQEV